MKRIALPVIVLCLALTGVRAQDAPGKVSNPLAMDNNFRDTPWFTSTNSAGMAFAPLRSYNDLNLTYDHANGKYKLQQSPDELNDISVGTSGALDLKGIKLQGNFSFNNNFEEGCKYNAIRYEEEDDMPYTLTDTVSSGWMKQEYILGAKIASPVLWNRVSFGLGLDYVTKVGAKQKDPRCEVYKYYLDVTPSVAVKISSRFTLGANFFYENLFERSTPSNEGWGMPKIVWIMKGLGESKLSKVGDNDGRKTYFYKGNAFGGSLQMDWSNGEDFEVFAQAGYSLRTVESFHNPKMPERMGTAKRTRFSGDVKMFIGQNKMHCITINGYYQPTDGLEYIQTRNDEAFNQRFEVQAVNKMSSFTSMSLEAAYDCRLGKNENGYVWKFGAAAGYFSRNNAYNLSPVKNKDTSRSAYGSLNAEREIGFRNCGLGIGIDALFNLGLGGGYSYAGATAQPCVQELFQLNNDYYTASYAKGGLKIAFHHDTKRGGSWYANLTGAYLAPVSFPGNRFCCNAAIGLIF